MNFDNLIKWIIGGVLASYLSGHLPDLQDVGVEGAGADRLLISGFKLGQSEVF